MLRSISKIFRSFKSKTLVEPVIISPANNVFDQKKISSSAIKVVEKLRLSGYESYIVGGCVRDLLMGMKPKDFDVATNATPEQVRVLFSRSRIIGRRFQIVHVRVGSEMIEVTTFRAQHTEIKNELSAVGNGRFVPILFGRKPTTKLFLRLQRSYILVKCQFKQDCTKQKNSKLGKYRSRI